jgi:hypothetical protein
VAGIPTAPDPRHPLDLDSPCDIADTRGLTSATQVSVRATSMFHTIRNMTLKILTVLCPTLGLGVLVEAFAGLDNELASIDVGVCAHR